MNRQSTWHVGRNDQGGADTPEDAQRPAPAVAELRARIEVLEQRQRPTREARRLRRRIVTPAVAVGLVVALTGIAHAAIGGGGVITGCYTKAALRGQHALTLIDPASGTTCASTQTTLTWNQTGPQGPQGDTGPQGPPGETGATGPQGPAAVAGIVTADGTLGGLGAGFTATRNSPGNYTVSWPINTFSGFADPVVTSVQSTAAPNIQRFAIAGNGGGTFTVDFSGVDTSFSFALIQERAPASPATSTQSSAQLKPITSR